MTNKIEEINAYYDVFDLHYGGMTDSRISKLSQFLHTKIHAGDDSNGAADIDSLRADPSSSARAADMLRSAVKAVRGK